MGQVGGVGAEQSSGTGRRCGGRAVEWAVDGVGGGVSRVSREES